MLQQKLLREFIFQDVRNLNLTYLIKLILIVQYNFFATKMASIQLLGISGVRSYSPAKLQQINFFHPLTLIYGTNGSGKTVLIPSCQTVIECLKYITTGSHPPHSDKGKSFAMDPKLAGTPQVKADIRLRFRTGKGKHVIAKKIFTVNKTSKTTSYKSEEQTLRTKDSQGKQIQINQRCADIEKQIPEMLGMSKSILENIVFCHQDDSLWPFSDSTSLKNIFDELFGTKKMMKVMETVKQSMKQFSDEHKTLKAQIGFMKSGYTKAAQNRTQKLTTLLKTLNLSQQLCKEREALTNLQKQIEENEKKLGETNKIIQNKGALEYRKMQISESIQRLIIKSNETGKQLQEINVDEGKEKKQTILAEKRRKSKNLQEIVRRIRSAKDQQFSNAKFIQFKADLKKAREFYPQVQKEAKQGVKNVVLFIKMKYEELKEMQVRNNRLKRQIHELSIPTINQEEQNSISSLQQEFQKKKSHLGKIQTTIKMAFNTLYKNIDPNLQRKYVQLDKEAGKKLQKLKVQHQIKKEQLEKYKRMPIKNKSFEQEVYQLQYAGIQLQNEMLNFLRQKKACLFCMKPLSREERAEMEKKVDKMKNKTKIMIEQMKKNYDPSSEIDPTPLIREIQKFLEESQKLQEHLAEQKLRYEEFQKINSQKTLNGELKRIMKDINIPTYSQTSQKIQKQITLHQFQDLAKKYTIYQEEVKNLQRQLERQKQREIYSKRVKKQIQEKQEKKQKLYNEICSLSKKTQSIRVIENIAKNLEKLLPYVQQNEQVENHSQNIDDLQGKQYVLTNELKDLQKRQKQIQNDIQYTNLTSSMKEILTRLQQINQILDSSNATIKTNTQLLEQRNILKIEETKLKQKIAMNKSLSKTYLQEDKVYLEKLNRFNALTLMIEDVQHSIKAMQRASNKLHNDKMDEINKILFDIWKEVYHGGDIEFIKINSVSEKKNGYGYSIMMCKNGQLLDMKGRCSMGQKVLASLIIRMALAQAFSSNTRILALDQPTTNLDRSHIQNFALSIGNILQMQSGSPLQLIIISHDMEFINLLKRYTSYYYEIGRDEKNFSTIKKTDINRIGEKKMNEK